MPRSTVTVMRDGTIDIIVVPRYACPTRLTLDLAKLSLLCERAARERTPASEPVSPEVAHDVIADPSQWH